GLAEHTPHCDAAERNELLAHELGKAVAGNHPPSSVPVRRSWLRRIAQTMLLVSRTVAGSIQKLLKIGPMRGGAKWLAYSSQDHRTASASWRPGSQSIKATRSYCTGAMRVEVVTRSRRQLAPGGLSA